MVVHAKNLVHSVLFPIRVFRNTSGLLLLSGLNFFRYDLPGGSYRSYSRFIPIRVYDVSYSNSGEHKEVLRYLLSGIMDWSFVGNVLHFR